MLQLMLRPLFILLALLMVTVTMVRAGYGLAHPLQAHDIFLNPACENLCWMGIELFETPATDVSLLHQTINKDDIEIPPYLQPAEAALPLMRTETLPGTFSRMRSSVSDTVVTSLGFNYRPCPGAVIAQFGLPDAAYVNEITGLVFYFEEGMVLKHMTEHNYFDIEIQRGGDSPINPNYTSVTQLSRYEGMMRLRALC
ncbi:MAG: hypothetical protein AAFV33_18695 [Chloroflexota bacterium]